MDQPHLTVAYTLVAPPPEEIRAQPMPAAIERPPEPLNPQRRPRRVGIEIEFGGIGVGDAAAMVQELYGGTIREVSRHRLEVAATRFGDFRVEIDSHYVHGAAVDGGTLAADDARLAAACRAHLEIRPAGSWKERLREALEP